jgi:hypothetical protein
MRDYLKKTLTALIEGNEEAAELNLHGYLREKIRSLMSPVTEAGHGSEKVYHFQINFGKPPTLGDMKKAMGVDDDTWDFESICDQIASDYDVKCKEINVDKDRLADVSFEADEGDGAQAAQDIIDWLYKTNLRTAHAHWRAIVSDEDKDEDEDVGELPRNKGFHIGFSKPIDMPPSQFWNILKNIGREHGAVFFMADENTATYTSKADPSAMKDSVSAIIDSMKEKFPGVNFTSKMF